MNYSREYYDSPEYHYASVTNCWVNFLVCIVTTIIFITKSTKNTYYIWLYFAIPSVLGAFNALLVTQIGWAMYRRRMRGRENQLLPEHRNAS